MGEPGGIVEKELTIHVSNVAHVDPTVAQADPGRLQDPRGRAQGSVRPPFGRSHRQVSKAMARARLHEVYDKRRSVRR